VELVVRRRNERVHVLAQQVQLVNLGDIDRQVKLGTAQRTRRISLHPFGNARGVENMGARGHLDCVGATAEAVDTNGALGGDQHTGGQRQVRFNLALVALMNAARGETGVVRAVNTAVQLGHARVVFKLLGTNDT